MGFDEELIITGYSLLSIFVISLVVVTICCTLRHKKQSNLNLHNNNIGLYDDVIMTSYSRDMIGRYGEGGVIRVVDDDLWVGDCEPIRSSAPSKRYYSTLNYSPCVTGFNIKRTSNSVYELPPNILMGEFSSDDCGLNETSTAVYETKQHGGEDSLKSNEIEQMDYAEIIDKMGVKLTVFHDFRSHLSHESMISFNKKLIV